jgi:DNA-3-methyladenine glycosylase
LERYRLIRPWAGVDAGTFAGVSLIDATADPLDAARRLLGAVLTSTFEGVATSARITEVEAYGGEDDPASHAFGGPSARNRSMFGRAGLLYVYRSYGIHACANVVVGREGLAAAVLLRAGDLVEGSDLARRRRGRRDHLADGPGKLCEALGIDTEHDGLDLLDPTSPVRLRPGRPPTRIEATPRIGISRAVDVPWRLVEVRG